MIFFYLFFISLPFQFALSSIAGIDLALGRVTALALLAAGLAASLAHRSARVSLSLVSISLLLFCGWAGASLIWSHAWLLGFRRLLFLLNFVGLFWALPYFLRKARYRLEPLLVYPGVIAVVVGIGQFLSQFLLGLDPVMGFWRALAPFVFGKSFGAQVLLHSSWLVEVGGRALMRAIAFFPDPHIFGFYLAFIIPLALLSKKSLFKGFGILFIVDLLLTFSRQAYVGALVALIAFLVVKINEKRKTRSAKEQFKMQKKEYFKLCVVVLSFSLFAFSLLSTPAGSRFLSAFNPLEGSNQERLANWNQALGLIRAHPLQGVGLGNYAFALDPSLDPRAPVYAHNLYLDIAAELGLVGLGIFLCVLVFAFIRLGIAGSPFFYSLVWFCVQSLFDTPLYSVHILPLFILVLALSDI